MYNLEGDDFNKLINQFVVLDLHNSYWAPNFINTWFQKLEIDEFHTIEINPLPDFHLNQIWHSQSAYPTSNYLYATKTCDFDSFCRISIKPIVSLSTPFVSKRIKRRLRLYRL